MHLQCLKMNRKVFLLLTVLTDYLIPLSIYWHFKERKYGCNMAFSSNIPRNVICLNQTSGKYLFLIGCMWRKCFGPVPHRLISWVRQDRHTASTFKQAETGVDQTSTSSQSLGVIPDHSVHYTLIDRKSSFPHQKASHSETLISTWLCVMCTTCLQSTKLKMASACTSSL